MAQGQWDTGLEKILARLQEAARVKMQYGPEYYADPATTEVGLTPRDLVWEQGKFKLYRYCGNTAAKPGVAPLLIIYSLINRPYILDLLPGVSLIEYYLQADLPVYLVDWGTPDYNDRHISLDELIDPYLREMVEFIRQAENCPAVSLLGHCIGGVLACLFAARYPEQTHRLLTLTTPITADQGGLISQCVKNFPLGPIIDTFGNMPGKLIQYVILAMKPYYEMIRWRRFHEQIENDAAMRVFYAADKWGNDNVDVIGAAFRKFIQEVYLEDRFRAGLTEIHGRAAPLSAIRAPLMNIVAEEDWLVPPATAEILNDLVGSSQKILRKISGPHLSILFYPKHRKIWQEMVQFFAGKE
jgi:polyhydroxyalkanoate synthase